MPNICDNHFYFCADNNADYYEGMFKNITETNFDGDGDLTSIDKQTDGGIVIEGYFDSRWSFPQSVFEDRFLKEDDCYFRCLSEEYGMWL